VDAIPIGKRAKTMDKPIPADIWQYFLLLCVEYIADLAEVNTVAVYNMFIGEPVARWQAEDVLRVISMITGGNYNLDTVRVALLEDS
jgi:hypothetical protein